jgi:hypothetical protein
MIAAGASTTDALAAHGADWRGAFNAAGALPPGTAPRLG